LCSKVESRTPQGKKGRKRRERGEQKDKMGVKEQNAIGLHVDAKRMISRLVQKAVVF